MTGYNLRCTYFHLVVMFYKNFIYKYSFIFLEYLDYNKIIQMIPLILIWLDRIFWLLNEQTTLLSHLLIGFVEC